MKLMLHFAPALMAALENSTSKGNDDKEMKEMRESVVMFLLIFFPLNVRPCSKLIAELALFSESN